MQLAQVTLDDKYNLQSGRVYLNGVQALVRLPIMQVQRDAAAGLKTGGFISGYRGSPLGAYDYALWSAKRFLERSRIKFQPGVNEDLAATAIWGSQQVNLYEGATVDGVFGIWYGKGPRRRPLDRRAETRQRRRHVAAWRRAAARRRRSRLPILHPRPSERAGADRRDDPRDQPGDGAGISRFRRHRSSPCRAIPAAGWVSRRSPSAVESSASVAVDPHRVEIVLPADYEMPPGGLNIRWPDTALEQERRLHGPKMDAVLAFARANPLDRLVFDPPNARFGIMATGKAYLDVRQALDDLGLDDAKAARLGIRLYKVGLSWPLEPQGAKRFAAGLEEVLVVEEKRPLIEDQLVKLLYQSRRRTAPAHHRQA